MQNPQKMEFMELYINDLILDLIIGQEIWETAFAQKIAINITLNLTQDIELNHFALIELITNYSQTTKFSSLGELAKGIQNLLLTNYPQNIENMQIVTKKLFPATNIKEIGILLRS